MQGKRAVIFANGELPAPEAVRKWIEADDLLIAADGGSRYAFALGLNPQVIIGDLDSLTAGAKALAEDQRTNFIVYPRDKDETDLELALQYAIQQGCTSIRAWRPPRPDPRQPVPADRSCLAASRHLPG